MIQKHKQTQTFQSFYQKPAEWTCSASSWTHGVATSIDRQVDPSDETGGVRGEERDALRHLLHLAGPAERVRLLTASQKLQERIDPSVWRFAINPEVVGLTLAYCSSSSPARLWTSVMITPGLKHKRRPIVRKMFLRIHPEASFCTYHTEFTLTCLGASSATEISLVKFSELWGTFTRTPLTQRYAARELVDGRLGHAVRQHTWKLSGETRSDRTEKPGPAQDGGHAQISGRSRWTRSRWSLWSGSGEERTAESGGTQTWKSSRGSWVNRAETIDVLETLPRKTIGLLHSELLSVRKMPQEQVKNLFIGAKQLIL